MAFSFGNLFGYEKEIPASTPKQCFFNHYQKVKNGDIETLFAIVKPSMISKKQVDDMGGLAQGYLKRYLTKLFTQTVLEGQGVPCGDSMHGAVAVTGETVNFKVLLSEVKHQLIIREAEFGFLTGEKVHLRQIGLLVDLIEECLKTCGVVLVDTQVTMCKIENIWVLNPENSGMDKALFGMTAAELEAFLVELFKDFIPEDKK